MSTTMDSIADHGRAHHHSDVDRTGTPLIDMRAVCTRSCGDDRWKRMPRVCGWALRRSKRAVRNVPARQVSAPRWAVILRWIAAPAVAYASTAGSGFGGGDPYCCSCSCSSSNFFGPGVGNAANIDAFVRCFICRCAHCHGYRAQ